MNVVSETPAPDNTVPTNQAPVGTTLAVGTTPAGVSGPTGGLTSGTATVVPFTTQDSTVPETLVYTHDSKSQADIPSTQDRLQFRSTSSNTADNRFQFRPTPSTNIADVVTTDFNFDLLRCQILQIGHVLLLEFNSALLLRISTLCR